MSDKRLRSYFFAQVIALRSHVFRARSDTQTDTHRGQTAQAAPAPTQEILIPWGGLQPPHSNMHLFFGPVRKNISRFIDLISKLAKSALGRPEAKCFLDR